MVFNLLPLSNNVRLSSNDLKTSLSYSCCHFPDITRPRCRSDDFVPKLHIIWHCCVSYRMLHRCKNFWSFVKNIFHIFRWYRLDFAKVCMDLFVEKVIWNILPVHLRFQPWSNYWAAFECPRFSNVFRDFRTWYWNKPRKQAQINMMVWGNRFRFSTSVENWKYYYAFFFYCAYGIVSPVENNSLCRNIQMHFSQTVRLYV